MDTESNHIDLKEGVKKGTAKRRAGKETSVKIINAARELLTQENYSKFSMRNIAKLAGVNLRNLQYYYPSPEDLANALFLDLLSTVRANHEACIAKAGPTEVERFEAILRFELQDIMCREARQFFLQLWVLIGSMDNYEGTMLGKIFSLRIALFTEHIKELDPTASEEEIRYRTTLLESVFEGLMIVLASHRQDAPETKKFIEYAYNQCMSIARGD